MNSLRVARREAGLVMVREKWRGIRSKPNTPQLSENLYPGRDTSTLRTGYLGGICLRLDRGRTRAFDTGI